MVVSEQRTIRDRLREGGERARRYFLGEIEQGPSTAPMEAIRSLSSPIWETHEQPYIVEARGGSSSPTSLSLAYDDNSLGVPGVAIKQGLLSERDRKQALLDVYKGCVWVSSAVDAIANRSTSGGWAVEPIDQDDQNESNQEKIKALLLRVNPDEDFNQLLRAIIRDMGIYGEAYCEIIWKGGIPFQLVKIDCPSMTYTLDPHGMVTKYTQSLDKSTETVDLSPDQVIRWWLPDPRASKAALSPISKVQDAVYQWNAMSEWATKFFKQGARPSFMVQFPDESSIDDARRFAKYFHENHTGRSNAHIPLMLFNGAKAIEFSKGTVEFDFLKSMGEVRDQILSAYGVPLSMLGIQETAHLGGGTGESADKAFKANVINPILQTILEKLNWRLVIDGFKIDDSCIVVRQSDLRNDDTISSIQDKKIRNGTLTINEARAEDGRGPVQGGDEAVFAVSKEVLTVADFISMADTNEQNTQLDLETKKAQLDKIKNPPAPPPVVVAPKDATAAKGKQQPEDEEEEQPTKSTK